MKSQTVVIEVLNINSVGRFLYEAFRKNIYKTTKIYFFDSTKIGLFLSNTFFLFGNQYPQRLEFHFDKLFDENNIRLFPCAIGRTSFVYSKQVNI